jgi:diaphanous 1
MLKNTLNKFTNDNRINDWLTIILAFGNYLNGQSMRGGAYGFKLDSLCKIVELKSNDNKITLLEFIIEWIYDNNDPSLLEVDLNYTKNTSLKVTKEFLNDIKGSFKTVKMLKDITKDVDSEKDKSKEFLLFYDEIIDKLNQKEKELNEINNEYEKLVLSFGEKIQDMTFERFFQIFTSFFDNVQLIKEKVDRKRKMLARKNKKKS